MKRFFLVLLTVTLFSVPAFATCSIDIQEPCTATIIDDLNTDLPDKIMPNQLNQLQKTDAFQPKYKQPYYNELINTEPTSQPTADYNSNCQFGVCLPDGSNFNEGGVLE